ncbi:MAG: hypothetical protein B0A82_06045 [Alkalinema sp. CACIAM 70d]|nr:MAG: hypothetical protein B0A82_06045 [Alkalinema sp. CACIAM 70d]
MFSWTAAKKVADDLVFAHTGKHLSDIEIKVLQGAWEGKTYEEMARTYGYSVEYLNKDVGNKLWRKLSESLAEPVTKRNFKEALHRAWIGTQDCQQTVLSSGDHMGDHVNDRRLDVVIIPFPEGAIALESPLYIERSQVEQRCHEAIAQPAALLRIKAPKLMGKTSLIHRILAQVAQQDYYTVYLDLGSCDRRVLTQLDMFLRWFCLMVGRQLNLENRLPDYWDTEILGSNDNCTVYFEEYLLSETATPIVLALDNLDRLFVQTEVVEDFLGMLRSWHEKGRVSSLWQKLRLTIAHSTEVYIPLDINQSPFNAGIPIELPEFHLEQIQVLADLHGLDWTAAECTILMQMVGGHPYLVRLALYYAKVRSLSAQQIVQSASTESGIYCDHLRRYLEILQQAPDLAQALMRVVNATKPVELDPMQIYKLHSMGLVHRKDNHVVPQCLLYQEYFSRVLM